MRVAINLICEPPQKTFPEFKERKEMRLFSFALLALLFLSTVVLAFEIRPVSSWTGTVHIRADGSVDPYDAPIGHDRRTLPIRLAIASLDRLL